MGKEKKYDYVKLSSLNLPNDLKKLNNAQLNSICKQIRDILIKTVSVNGGHLASNLGTVELTVALHSIFDCPYDKIIWDVGHQSYTHKILTGRLSKFKTLRKENGISGFPKPSESIYDTSISGHSSTSISTALGIATAMKKQNDNHYAIAVIGDGAFTGGLAFEGLNNAGKSDANVIVILNDNEMSISKNVGAFAKYLSEIRTEQSYLKTKSVVEQVLNKTPVVGKPIKTAIKTSKSAIRNMVIHANMFDDLGFEYVGPVDGHNIAELKQALYNAKAMKKPVLVHIYTTKGKGYAPAEQNPGQFHGIGSFEIKTGNPDIVEQNSFSTEWSKELSHFADSDNRICAITAAMKYGTGLQFYTKTHKDNYFDVGIAEEHAVTFGGGLSRMGMIPVFCVYSSFLQRAYDQILHDLSIDNLHYVLGIDRAGIVGEDGETHQGIYDVAFLTTIPNVTLYSPSDYFEMKCCLKKALYEDEGIVGVRYPRGKQNNNFVNQNNPDKNYIINNNDSDTLIISYGRLINNVYCAVDEINNIVDTLKLIKIFPIEDKIIEICKRYKHIIFFEEGIENGSIAEKLCAVLYTNHYKGTYLYRGIKGFVKQASVNNALKNCQLDTESIKELISKELLNNE